MKTYNKLVRDNVVPSIMKKGQPVTSHRAKPDEFTKALFSKLYEEAGELLQTETVEAQIEELADVLEVIEEIKDHASELGLLDRVYDAQTLKRSIRGGFKSRTILESA